MNINIYMEIHGNIFKIYTVCVCIYIYIIIYTVYTYYVCILFILLFSHLADAFVQSDLQ